jgi:hypothetical protein
MEDFLRNLESKYNLIFPDPKAEMKTGDYQWFRSKVRTGAEACLTMMVRQRLRVTGTPALPGYLGLLWSSERALIALLSHSLKHEMSVL